MKIEKTISLPNSSAQRTSFQSEFLKALKDIRPGEQFEFTNKYHTTHANMVTMASVLLDKKFITRNVDGKRIIYCFE